MSAFQITNRFKQDVRNARMIGEFTVKIGAQKLPGLIWSVVSKMRSSVYPETVQRIRPEDAPAPVVDQHHLCHALPNRAMDTTYSPAHKWLNSSRQ